MPNPTKTHSTVFSKTHLNSPKHRLDFSICKKPHHNFAQGFTLLELLITISIAFILIFVAVPNLIDFHHKQNADAVTAEIRRTLSVARQYAVSTQQIITTCGIADTNTCSKNNINSLLIFIDENNNKTLDSNEYHLLNREIKHQGSLKLSASFGAKHIQFTGDGSSKQTGSFIYCVPEKSTLARRIVFSLTGRSYIGKDMNGDGIIALANNKPITC